MDAVYLALAIVLWLLSLGMALGCARLTGARA
jgi:hypothetical protein